MKHLRARLITQIEKLLHSCIGMGTCRYLRWLKANNKIRFNWEFVIYFVLQHKICTNNNT
jgi:hypothetical protein